MGGTLGTCHGKGQGTWSPGMSWVHSAPQACYPSAGGLESMTESGSWFSLKLLPCPKRPDSVSMAPSLGSQPSTVVAVGGMSARLGSDPPPGGDAATSRVDRGARRRRSQKLISCSFQWGQGRQAVSSHDFCPGCPSPPNTDTD